MSDQWVSGSEYHELQKKYSLHGVKHHSVDTGHKWKCDRCRTNNNPVKIEL